MARVHEIVARLKAEGQSEYVSGTQEAAETTEAFADTTEESAERASVSWNKVANVTSAAMAGAGGALEAYNRSQQETRDVSARVGNAIGQTSDAVLEAAADMNNATRSVEESIEVMEIGSQRGIESIEGLKEYAATWDTIGDATGESAAELAQAAVSLEAVGVSAQEPQEAMAAFGFVSESTTATLGDFLKMTERVGRELGEEAAPHVNEMAALFGAMEAQGLGAQQAQREVRQALRETNGDMEAAREILGVTNDTLEEYRAQVEASTDVIEKNAAAVGDNRTTLQEWSADLESVMAKYSGLGQAAEVAAPLLLGGALTIQGVSRGVGLLSGRLDTLRNASRGALGGMRGLGGYLAGPWGVAVGVATASLVALVNQQRRVENSAESLREELEGQTAAFDTLNDQWLVAELRQRGALDAADELGLSLDQVRQIISGDRIVEDYTDDIGSLEGAFAILGDVVPGVETDFGRLKIATNELSQATDRYNANLTAEEELLGANNDALEANHRVNRDATSAVDDHNRALATTHRVNRDATSAVDDNHDALHGLETSLEDAKNAANRFNNEFERLAGSAISVEQALIRWDEELHDLGHTLDENAPTLERFNQDGRDNRKAILGAVEAAQQHASAMIEDGATTEEATQALKVHIGSLRSEMRQAGFTEEAIRSYIEQLNLTPNEIETLIEADTGPARGEVEAFTGDVTSMPAVPIDVGADTTPARREIGDLRNWILSRGVIDMSMNLSGFEQGAGDGAMPPGGSVINRLIGYMQSTGIPNRVTSTLRPGDDGYHGLARAVDFAGARPGIDTPNLRAIQEAFAPLAASGQLVELIGPNPALNFKRGIQGPGVYPADTREAHRNHVHTAMQLGGVIREPILGVGRSGATYSFGEAGDEIVTPMVNPVIDAVSRSSTAGRSTDDASSTATNSPEDMLRQAIREEGGITVQVDVHGDVLDVDDWTQRMRRPLAEAVADAVEDAKARQ